MLGLVRNVCLNIITVVKYRMGVSYSMTTDLSDTNGVFTVIFWKRTAERMIRGFAGGLVGTTVITTTGVSIDWKAKLLGAAGVAVTSLVLSLAGSFIGDSTDPSLIKPTGSTDGQDKAA